MYYVLYSFSYRQLYYEAYEKIKEYADTSVKAHLMEGLSFVASESGSVLEKIPFVGRSSLDEGLKDAGDALLEKKDIERYDLMRGFKNYNESGTSIFVNNINILKTLNNESLEVIYDEENLYISNDLEG